MITPAFIRTGYLGLVSFLLAAPPPALADGAQVDVDAASIAANGSVSGFPSHQNFTTRQPGNGALLYGIRGGETRDHPCHLELLWSRQNDTAHELFVTEWHREPCSADDRTDEEVRLSNPSPAEGIAALEVCNNNQDNRRLKGVRITKAGEIAFFGAPHLAGAPDVEGKFQRPNCADWAAASTCPANNVAVGVNIYHDEEGATGLELICGLARLQPPLASLSTVQKPEGPAILSPLAGVAGTKLRVMIGTNVDLPNDPLRYYGITSVLIEEAGDRPCRVALYGGALDSDKGPDDRKLAEASISGCSPGGIIDVMHAKLTKEPNHFLAAIDVCNSISGHNDRIKGLLLRAAQLHDDGTRSLEYTDADFQPHCGHTYGYQECPQWSVSDNRRGMIAIGLLMHHDGRAFTGIQLICRDVVSGPYTTLKQDSLGY
jgi:hypothetical protein